VRTFLSIFIQKVNRATRVLLSPHETATEKVFSPPFSNSLHFDLSSCYCSRDVHALLKWPESVVTHLRRDSFHRKDDALFQILQTSDTCAVHLVLCIPQRKKSMGVKSGDLSGYAVSNKYHT
jgi:hypothetical protein